MRNCLLQRTVTRCDAPLVLLRGAASASGLASVSLGSLERASFARNAIPPHVTDEHPGRETQDKNGIDRYVKHCSALQWLAMRPLSQPLDSTKTSPSGRRLNVNLERALRRASMPLSPRR